jgi:hypothetical protein
VSHFSGHMRSMATVWITETDNFHGGTQSSWKALGKSIRVQVQEQWPEPGGQS